MSVETVGMKGPLITILFEFFFFIQNSHIVMPAVFVQCLFIVYLLTYKYICMTWFYIGDSEASTYKGIMLLVHWR